MVRPFVLLMAGLMLTAAPAARPKPKVPAAKAKPNGSAGKAKAAAPKGRANGRRVARRPSTPPRPAAPSADRYREIQQALIDKGFLQGAATGSWDARSVEALNRYKQTQNLKPDGRIDALSLIGLGLGPKRQASSAVPAGETTQP